MSLLLRTSKRFVTLGRQSHNIYRKCPVRFLNSLTLSRVLLLSRNTRNFQTSFHLLNQQAQANFAANADSNVLHANLLDEKLFKMDADIRKQGRITIFQVQSIIEDMKKLGTVTSNQSLLIIRCCGSFMPETPSAVRTTLVDEIWKTITELGCPLDVSHYNTLLNIYLENEHKFEPVEFLSWMAENDITPNRVTYQRLIQRYCQDGDIEGSSKILEFMKSKELPVNEAIFHNLILGHSKANNMDDAKKILDVMRNSELIPTAGAYCALARGYAMNGDMESVLSTLEEAEVSDAALSDRELLSIINTLVVYNFGDCIDQILPKLEKKLGFNHDCLNLILELVNSGHHKIGFTLVSAMNRGTLADGSPAPSGLFFIRQIIRMNMAPELILDYCNKLKENGTNDIALLKATEISLLMEKPDYAIFFLKGLHAENYMLRPHFFWPVLVSKKKKSEEMFSVVKLMLELNCPADTDTFRDFVFPYMTSDDPVALVQRFVDDGNEVQLTVHAFVSHLLYRLDDVQASFNLLENFRVSISKRLMDELPVLLAKANDRKENASLPVTLNILQYAHENPKLYPRPSSVTENIFGLFVVEYLKNDNVGDLENILLYMKEKNCTISSSLADHILTLLDQHWNKEVKGLGELVKSVISPEDLSESMTPEFGKKKFEMSQGELESALTDIQPRSAGRREVLKRMLLVCCRERNVQRAESLLEEMKANNYSLPATFLTALMNMYSQEYNLDQAYHYYRLLESQFSGFVVENFKLINLAAAFAKEQKFEEMEKLLLQASTQTMANMSLDNLERNIVRLLTAVSEAGQPEKTREVFELCVKLKFCKPTPRLLGRIILTHLVKNDMYGAIEELKRISNQYGCAPVAQQVCKKLIEQENTDQLQEVMQLMTKHHGQMNAMFELACSFLELGRVKQAKKILSAPGLRAIPERMDFHCESFINEDKIDCLENFVTITKDIFGIDRDQMFQHLIRGYAKSENVDKALGVWVQMQEENVHPSDHTLHLLGTFLRRMNKTPPFSVPEKPLEKVSTMSRSKGHFNLPRNKQPVNSAPTVLRELVDCGNLTDAIELVLKYNEKEMDTSRKDVKLLARSLSELGNVDAIRQIQNRAGSHARLFLNDDLGLAYVKCGQGREFLNSLETEASKYAEHFPDKAIMALIDNNPEDIDKVKKVIERNYSDHKVRIENMFWSYHMKMKNFDKADSIFQSSPELKSFINMMPLIEYCRKFNDEEVSKKLFEVIKKTDMSHHGVGIAASVHINVLMTTWKLDEAVEFVQSELNATEQKYLTQGAVKRLASKLRINGKPLPAICHSIPGWKELQ